MSYKEKDVIMDMRRPDRGQVTLGKSFDFSALQFLCL